VTANASADYLKQFIRNSQQVIKSGNKRAVALFAEYKVPMPAHPQLSETDISAILAFIHTHKKQVIAENTAELGPVITDPIPTKIAKSGLTLKLEEFATAPPTGTKNPLARINQMTVLKGAKGNRTFINDMRGKLYELKGKTFNEVFDIKALRPNFISEPGLASGLGSYVFHPDFYKNGLFYTTHTEKKGSAPADFLYADSLPVALQWVVTEWKFNPSAEKFEGGGREMLRINMPTPMHGMQQLTFNPLTKPGNADYGLLYLGIGDGGSAEYNFAFLCNTNTQLRSSVIRIDPAGHNSANKKYGIPPSNPWAKDADPKTLGEVFCRGFRNPNRIEWATDGRMLISEIGLNNVEELNIGKPGFDYGWPAREGTFLLNYKGKMNKVYALPANDTRYTQPVAEYDHDEGNAISAGFFYTGSIAALKGKYVFGDIVKGRVFYVEAADLKLGSQATIKEFNVELNGTPSTFTAQVKNAKADMRLGKGEDNEIYIYTKVDGKMWKVVACE
jgi:glucose/arabinose dehydrogenase